MFCTYFTLFFTHLFGFTHVLHMFYTFLHFSGGYSSKIGPNFFTLSRDVMQRYDYETYEEVNLTIPSDTRISYGDQNVSIPTEIKNFVRQVRFSYSNRTS